MNRERFSSRLSWIKGHRTSFSFVVSKASVPSWCLNTTNAVVRDVNENVFVHTWSVHVQIIAMWCLCREFHGVSVL